MQQTKSSLLLWVSDTWGTSKSSFCAQSARLLRERPQGFFCTKVFSRAFWSATGMSPSSTSFARSSMMTSEGFTSLGHRMVQAPQEVQYHGRASSMADWNCFFLTSILTLKGVLPDSGQLPVHFPHWMHVNTLVAACSTITRNPRW